MEGRDGTWGGGMEGGLGGVEGWHRARVRLLLFWSGTLSSPPSLWQPPGVSKGPHRLRLRHHSQNSPPHLLLRSDPVPLLNSTDPLLPCRMPHAGHHKAQDKPAQVLQPSAAVERCHA